MSGKPFKELRDSKVEQPVFISVRHREQRSQTRSSCSQSLKPYFQCHPFPGPSTTLALQQNVQKKRCSLESTIGLDATATMGALRGERQRINPIKYTNK